MDWKYLFTSFDGRINRAKFWAAIGVFFALGIVGFIIDSVLGTRVTVGAGMQVGVVGIIISLASIYFALAVYAKRWHDRDKSGWLSAVLIAVFVVAAILAMVAPGLDTVMAIVELLVAIWFIVELGILKGTSGPNKYGPDPLG
jgi:uncharacterized membrane protein YhaH (DUF805 family)